MQQQIVLMAVVLILSAYYDLTSHRIPNGLSLGGAAIALVYSSVIGGTDGFLMAAGGFAVGLGLFLPFYLLRAMGAGDVKLLAAVGAFVGPKLAVACAAGSLITGAVLALFYVIVRGGLLHTLYRYAAMVRISAATQRFVYLVPTRDDPTVMRLPYATAMLLGSIAAVARVNGFLPLG